jgi:hypothetical protein
MVCRSTSRAAGSEELQASNERECLSAGWTKKFLLWLVIKVSSVNLFERESKGFPNAEKEVSQKEAAAAARHNRTSSQEDHDNATTKSFSQNKSG